MDTDFVQLQLMTRLKLQLKRRLDIKMDIHQFLADRSYAKEMLQIADQSEDEDLIMYSLQLSGHLGWLGAKSLAAKKAAYEPQRLAAEPKPLHADEATSSYIYGTRG
ncbi:MAG: hypothetical protein P4L77_15265 [Sulfuriferula sp.]|nr:hypothetical protein [Sulfuriferula sp.]